MSVYAQITLPPAARLRDVATVLARLTGAPISLVTTPVLAAQVDGIMFQPLPETPECVSIRWIDGDRMSRSVLYHFEWSDVPGSHGMMLRSDPEGVALGKALVDFFGDSVDYRDNDDIEEDYIVPARGDIHASDGEAWDAFQRRMAFVNPLTPAKIAAMQPFSAYTAW